MAKSKTKKEKVEEHASVTMLRAIAHETNGISVPKSVQERFDPQLTRIVTRVHKIADNLQKAITLDATKAEREAARAEREKARVEKLLAQAAKIEEKLAALKEKKSK